MLNLFLCAYDRAAGKGLSSEPPFKRAKAGASSGRGSAGLESMRAATRRGGDDRFGPAKEGEQVRRALSWTPTLLPAEAVAKATRVLGRE